MATMLDGSTVKIQEVDEDNGKSYAADTVTCDMSVNNGQVDWSLPIDIWILGAQIQASTENIDATIEACAAPETTIGAITSDVAASDTIINVQQSVIDNIKVGYLVHLDDGTNSEQFAYCTAVDDVNNQITVDTGAVNAYAAATPTYVKMTIPRIRKLVMRSTGRIEIGEMKIGASRLPAGTVLQVKYNGAAGTKCHVFVEYLY